ncbi:MAG: hypothetical protein JWM05_184 [Acidimicrobiales bacterium]|nr:hypothetical protein [Acidimicrobiales bacterium]
MMVAMEATSLRFAAAVRTLAQAARAQRLAVPGFRSPPRVAGADRTLRRRSDGAAIVAVALRGRPFEAVVADMIEGIVVANALDGATATRVRTSLWEAAVGGLEAAA